MMLSKGLKDDYYSCKYTISFLIFDEIQYYKLVRAVFDTRRCFVNTCENYLEEKM